MQLTNAVFGLALVAGAIAAPNPGAPAKPAGDACAAAVTGVAALGDEHIRKAHCSSYLLTVVTPEATTVTTTITADPKETNWSDWKREKVTVCPNEVPNYASACNEKGYSSACGLLGFKGDKTTTIARQTVTKTVYVKPAACTSGAGATKTVTVTASGSGFPYPTGKPEVCSKEADAKYFIASFTDFLENTDFGGAGKFNHDLAKKVLTEDFKDFSDSINFMINSQVPAGVPLPKPLGTVTFDGRAAFEAAQSSQPPVPVTTLNFWFNCKTITWRWKITAFESSGLPVQGISVLEITDDLKKIKVNYAEFDNAAWLKALAALSASSNTTKRSELPEVFRPSY